MKLTLTMLIFAFTLLTASNSQAQSVSYPNELKGYKLYGKGKLAALKLGTSTKEDIKRIFGADCEISCALDKNWTVEFGFLTGDAAKQITEGEDNFKREYIPAKEYIGKLSSITVKPTKRVSFAGLISSKSLRFAGGGGICLFGESGGTNIFYNIYVAGDGLSYAVCSKHSGYLCRNEELYSIEYSLPQALEEAMWIEK